MDDTQQAQIILNALLESFPYILNQNDFQSAAHSIADSCMRAIGATAGYVALLAADANEYEDLLLVTLGEFCDNDLLLPTPIREMHQEVYRTNKTLYESNFTDTPWVGFIPDGNTKIINALIAPLMIEGRTVGLLGLVNKLGGFSQEDVRNATAFGKLAAVAYLNSQSIEKLANSELRFRSIAQSAGDAIITIDKSGNIIFWNKAATTIFGYMENEVVGEQLSLIMPDRLHKGHREGLERLVSEGEPHLLGKVVEMVGLTKDGREIPVELTLASWKINNDVFFSGIIRDISERNRSQREIQNLAKFPEENRNPVLRVSQDEKIIFANQASNSLIASWENQDGRDVPDHIVHLVSDALSSGETRTTEIPCGEQIYSFDLVPVQENHYVNLYGRDVSDEVRASKLLSEQNQFIMSIFESIRHPFYVVDANDYTIKMANPATYPNAARQRITCYQLTHHLNQPCGELGYDCPMELVKKTKESVTMEHTHYDGKGNRRIDEVHAHPVLDDQGNVIQVIEYLLDVTARKQIEEALKRERDFNSAVLNTAGALIVVLDQQGRILRFNRVCEQLTGYSFPEVKGQLIWEIFLLPEEIEAVKSVFNDLRSGLFPNENENYWLTKDGDPRLIKWSNTAILDSSESVEFIVGIGIDITKQRQIQGALLESEAKWRSLTENSPDHIIALDRDANIIFINHTVEGLSREHVINTSFYNYALDDFKQVTRECFERVLKTGQPDKFESIYRNNDGNYQYFESHVGPVIREKEIVGLIVRSTNITERKEIDQALRERTHALGERVKELNCLYSISALVEKPGVSLPEILQGTVGLIPPSWQYPEITCARIIMGEQEYRTDNFKENSTAILSSDIRVHDLQHGCLEVCYLEEVPECDEGPFLKEEISLINAISERLGRIVERLQAEEALQNANDELEERVRERTSELKMINQALELEIAERRRAYQAELDAREIAETLSEASWSLAHSLSIDTILNTLLEFIGRLIPFDSANIAIMEGESTIAVRAAHGYETYTGTEKILNLAYEVEDNAKLFNLLAAKRSVIIANTRQQPGWIVYPGTEHIRNWMGVPIVSGDKVIGLCGMDKTIPDFFTHEHLQLAEAIIGQAGVAIQNAWLFEQLRAGRERLQSLSRRLVEVQEEERSYIARELHDEAGQSLTSIKVGLQLLEREANNPEAIHTGIRKLQKMIDEVSEDLHRLAVDLRPATLDHLGLEVALRHYVQNFSEKYNITAQFEVVNWDQPMGDDVDAAIFRIVQEALTNIIRHAQATRVDVILDQLDGRAIIVVEDNGIGFEPNKITDQDCIGICGMRDRAELLGGMLTIESSAGGGTALFVEVPYVDSYTHS